MKRRDFVTLLGGAAAAWPLAARAEQPDRVRRIGVLMAWPESDPEAQSQLASFVQELQKLGWTEGRNLRIDTRWWIPADPESTHRFAKELVTLRPDVILSHGTATTAALLRETRTIPIVFAIVADPIGSGFVASLARPGGNTTGFVVMEGSFGGKWLELLKEIAPRVVGVAVSVQPCNGAICRILAEPLQGRRYVLRFEVTVAPIHDASELETVIAAQARKPNRGLFVLPDPFTNAYRVEITSLAVRYRLPAVYAFRSFAELGGLLSYGNDLNDNFRRAAIYADRILKGDKPGELPVQAPVKFELVINLKTAKALGLDVPLFLQQLADEVIE